MTDCPTARIASILRTAVLIVATAALAGCGILPKQETLALYRPEPAVSVDPAWPQANWQLQIARPYADDMHDSSRILVRPRSGELQVYKGAAWTQPAPDMVLDTLLRAFADSGRLGSLDIMELNPALDIRNKTAMLAVDLVESLFGKSTLMRD